MCGICGFINKLDYEHAMTTITGMTNVLSHRGPNEQGIWGDENMMLGHRRLSIIDLSNGQQPMFNEDRSVVVVFNGEIYNHRQYREILTSRQHVFKTNCDTEILLHLYEEYGTKMVQMLEGMFAFAIYDLKNRRLLLSRDRMGQKPLWYFYNGSDFVFGSELNALKQHPIMQERRINLNSVHDFLSYSYIPSPQSIYDNVFKLSPGSYLTFDLNNKFLQETRYWNLDYRTKFTGTFDDAQVQLRLLLGNAVEKRLMSDVKSGAFLSGGVDSSIICALMSEKSQRVIPTFTIGFDQNSYDERTYAHLAAKSIEKYSHHPVEEFVKVVRADDFSLVSKLIDHYGEPYADASMLPTYLLCKFAATEVTVALSGDGADELFGGYERYLLMKYAQMSDKLPSSVKKNIYRCLKPLFPERGERTRTGRLMRALRVVSTPAEQRYFENLTRLNENFKKQLYAPQLQNAQLHDSGDYISKIYEQTTSIDPVERFMESDIHSYLLNDILVKIDIASMAASLEMRSPFMDHHLVEFAASLPLDFKLHGSSRKHILKSAYSNLLSPKLMNRPKKGFGVPLAHWFRTLWRTPLYDTLLDGKLIKDGFINRNAVKNMLQKHDNNEFDYSYALWHLLILELFMQKENN